jgi:glucokinase-like ROK family protein
MPQQARFRTGDQTLVREINLSLIMQRLRMHSSLSRAALAEVTGLNKSTVSSLVQELIAHHLVREIGLDSSGIGRPSILLELNPEAGYIVSCEIGVDFISIVCANFGTQILWRHKESTKNIKGQQAIMNRVLALLHDAVDEGRALCPGCGGLLGLSVGVPGLVNRTDGTLLFAPNLKWENVPLRSILQDAFDGIPIFVENEACMAALGEYFFGAAKDYEEVLFISAGVGLGGAIVRSGHLFKGKTGFASEFGHMTMDPDGERCNCGNQGCWETQVSQSAVFRHIRRSVQNGQPSLLCDMTDNELDRLTIPLVVEAARNMDRVALDALEQVGHHLGIGIASLVNALNPDLVVFGGILSLANEFLLPVVNAELQQRALRWNAAATHIVPAQHGFDACVMGGVAIVYQTVLSQPDSAQR